MLNVQTAPKDLCFYEGMKQDLIISTQNKSNALEAQRKTSVHLMHNNSKGQFGPNKPTIIEMVLEAIGMRNQKNQKEPTMREFGALIMLGFMFLLFVISITGFIVMWFTEYYNNTMLEKLVLAPNSERVNGWLEPEPEYDTLFKAHIFNYTNIDDYLKGRADKIQVVDIGTLTYQEHTVKRNVVFNANYTVTYRDHKSYKFLPDKSSVSEDAVVMVPNIPLLTAAAKYEELSSTTKAFLRVFCGWEPAFKKLKARELLWGYRDRISSWGTDKTHFGILMNRNGTSIDSVQVNTGEDDLRKYSIITQFNGLPTLGFWSGEECNRIDGSDPAMYSPFLLENREPVDVFLQVVCRKVPLHFEREVTIYKNIDALRYRTPLNVFGSPKDNPANQCYCENTKRCLPSGVINATKCYADAPIYPSFPHFFSGDPAIYKEFEGINPDADLHQTFADIHPRFAFPIGGASRVQINIAVHKNEMLQWKLQRFEDGMLLPLVWIEITNGDFSQEMLDSLHLSTFGLNAIQVALKYGTLLTSVTLFSLIVAIIYYIKRKREELLNEHKAITEVVALNTAGSVEPTAPELD